MIASCSTRGGTGVTNLATSGMYIVWCVDPIVRRRNSSRIERKTYSRYLGRSRGPQIQFTKSCVVAIGSAMIAENPTDAVRETITVPAGRTRAAEFATPSGLTFSAVSWISSTRPSRICQTSASETHGIVHSSGIQYSGC